MKRRKTIAECTEVIPEIIAEVVLGDEASKGKIISLVNRAETLYQHNRTWKHRLKSENANRILYNFMKHWAKAKIWYRSYGTVDYIHL